MGHPIIVPFKRLEPEVARALAKRMEERPAAYTYYCLAGDHNWTFLPHKPSPDMPMDGCTFNCPHHNNRILESDIEQD